MIILHSWLDSPLVAAKGMYLMKAALTFESLYSTLLVFKVLLDTDQAHAD